MQVHIPKYENYFLFVNYVSLFHDCMAVHIFVAKDGSGRERERERLKKSKIEKTILVNNNMKRKKIIMMILYVCLVHIQRHLQQ